MRVLFERCAAVDVGTDVIVIAVAVRLPGGGPDCPVTHKRVLKTFYGVLPGPRPRDPPPHRQARGPRPPCHPPGRRRLT